MRYLDSNVFLYAALGEGRQANAAVRSLREMMDGERPAATSALTIDEVAWSAWKLVSPDFARAEAGRILAMPNLRVLPATLETIRASIGLMEGVPSLKPRDAIHAATAIAAGIFTIVSDDKDFDRVPELTREPLA